MEYAMSKIRVKFSKFDQLKYISHLDMMRVFQRAIRRSGLNLKHSEGFNPHPLMSFSTAIGLGLETDGDYMDVEFLDEISPEAFIERVNTYLPLGLKMVKGKYIEAGDKAIMAQIRWGSYAMEIKNMDKVAQEKLSKAIENFLMRDEIIHESEKKKKHKMVLRQVNVREMIGKIDVLMSGEDYMILKFFIRTGSEGNIKPELVMDLLEKYEDVKLEAENITIKRIELYVEKEEIQTPV